MRKESKSKVEISQIPNQEINNKIFPELSFQEDSIVVQLFDNNNYLSLTGTPSDRGCRGHVAQWIERLSHSREDAGSKMTRKSCRARTNLISDNLIQDKKEKQANSLDKAPVSLTGISHKFFLTSEKHRNSRTLEYDKLKRYINFSIISFDPYAVECPLYSKNFLSDIEGLRNAESDMNEVIE